MKEYTFWITLLMACSTFLAFCTLVSLSTYWKHMLSALILMEFLALSIYMPILQLYANTPNASLMLVYLTILVCSSVLSLSIMLNYARKEGSELFKVST